MRFWLLILVVGVALIAGGAEPPVTPGATPQARALLAWLAEQKQIVSGQAEPAPGGGALAPSTEREFERILKVTGKTPAIRAFDLYAVTPVSSNKPPLAEVDRAISWGRGNGIVAIQWHWLVSNRSGGYDFAVKGAEDRENGWRGFDLDRALTSGTPENDELLAGIDAAAAELARLRDAGIPVLWRPLHESSGRWFWWGANGPEPFKKLWRLMYQRMTFRHHLNNLLWVFTPAEPEALEEWYPGDEYVDIVGLDRYADTGEHPSFKQDYEVLRRFCQGRKVLALTENGSIPDPDLLVKDQAKWAFFCTWCGNFVLDNKVNPSNYLARVYRNPYVVSRDTLPFFQSLPAPPSAGPAKKIVFVRQPVAMSAGGRMVSPVMVVAEDGAGQVVREVSGNVVLKLQGLRSAPLEAAFFNGVASFVPEGLTNKSTSLRFVAEAENLGTTISNPFEVGPGRGIGWELWNGLADADRVMQAPANSTGRARDRFEVAFKRGTVLRAKGVVIPPVSGNYVFWIAAADRASLKVQGTQVAAVTKSAEVREWNVTPSQRSAPIELQAGVRCAIEACVESATEGGHLEVGWTLPDGSEERPIQGRHLE